ncbi:hypothetical protein [Clostridioides difficile]
MWYIKVATKECPEPVPPSFISTMWYIKVLIRTGYLSFLACFISTMWYIKIRKSNIVITYVIVLYQLCGM